MTKPKNYDRHDEVITPAETERIREATLKRLLSSPPKRHDEMIDDRKAKRPKAKP